MRIFSIFFLLLVLSCNNNEDFINKVIDKNKISIINVEQKPISQTEVLSEFDNTFLKKYNFSEKEKNKDTLLKISKIISTVSNDKREFTKISLPIYSKDNKFCLLQIISFTQKTGYSNTIYLFKNNKNIWITENKFDSKLFN
ncbi:hypothetical protein [Chryseobacterium viscerum]|uniref:Lipoprotein n=1 Tax=Chryseobacterium viscerum TaxID=1037377 RepID=A0A316X236_9FLAO|nr:hypothetical protein [Chryseobacterium viscerum]PWN65328.1 hypothetical protein C1634_000885 [Chryseobacterium viscerum]